MSDHLPSVTIVRRIKAAPAKPFDGGTVLTLTHERLPLAYRPGL